MYYLFSCFISLFFNLHINIIQPLYYLQKKMVFFNIYRRFGKIAHKIGDKAMSTTMRKSRQGGHFSGTLDHTNKILSGHSKSANSLNKVFRSGIRTNKNMIKFNKSNINYNSSRAQANKLAIKWGFQNEKNFAKFISSSEVLTDTTRIYKVFNNLKKFAKKHPKSIAKFAVASGTVSGMVVYLRKYQEEHSGCNRYHKKSGNHYKFKGSFCYDSNTADTNPIHDTKHPLYHHNTWDCNYIHGLINENEPNESICKVFSLGCAGLCDWQNFNLLTQVTSGQYIPLEMNAETKIKINEYSYKCETYTILRTLTDSAANIVDDIYEGLSESVIGKKLYHFIQSKMSQILLILLILVCFFSLYKIINNKFGIKMVHERKLK